MAVLTVLLFSCTENADLFSSLDEPEGPKLSTVAAGAVVSPDEPLSIQLEYPEDEMSRATSMTVELREPDGTLSGELSFTEAQLLEPTLPAVELPRPQPGPYNLRVEAYRGDELLFTDDRQIFVISSPPSFDSVSVYPSTVGADAEAVAVADIVPGVGARPYIQWFFEGSPIGAGYVDGGAEKAVFAPGGRVGVHTVAAELFPWGPDEGVDVSLTSSITAETDVFIRDTPPERDPDERVLLRYRFTGRAAPDTDRASGAFRPIETEGDVILDVRDEELGYRIADGGRIRAPYNVLPEPSGAVRLTVRFARGEHVGTTTFRIVEDGDELVSIGIDAARSLFIDAANRMFDVSAVDYPRERASAHLGQDLSVLLVHAGDTVFLVPEMSGFLPVTIPISTDRSGSGTPPDTFFEISHDGSAGRIIRGIDVVRLDSAAERFHHADRTFLHDESRDDRVAPVRSTRVDLATEGVRAVVPDGRYLLWNGLDGTPRYLVRRNGRQIIVSRPDGEAAHAEISPDMYPTVVSGTVSSDELQFVAGDSSAITSDGTITFPLISDQQFIVIPGGYTVNAGSVTVAAER